MSLRLEDCLKRLPGLPALAPPDTLEERTLAAMAEAAAAAATPRRRFAPARAAALLAAAGVGVLIGATLTDFGPEDESGSVTVSARSNVGALRPGAAVSEPGARRESEPATTAESQTASAADDELVYAELAAEAAYLEQLLAAMPQRSVMRVSTAGTIAGLEDQIAVIDAELGQAASPEYRTLLMHNRVQVMNALVNVRYLQSTAFTY